jgi:hypothetical protein
MRDGVLFGDGIATKRLINGEPGMLKVAFGRMVRIQEALVRSITPANDLGAATLERRPIGRKFNKLGAFHRSLTSA